MKRITLLFFCSILLFQDVFSQNEVKYVTDTLFLKELRKTYDDYTDYKVLNLWIDRAEKMAKKQSFYDFDIALRNYKLVPLYKLNVDSVELYTNRLYNLMDQVKLNEYKILIANLIKSNSINKFKLGSESVKWYINGVPHNLNEEIADSIQSIINAKIEGPLDDLLKYHFPRESVNQNYADFFIVNNYYSISSQENSKSIYNQLSSFYRAKGYWEEYISLFDSNLNGFKGDKIALRLSFIEENADVEIVAMVNLLHVFKDIYGDKTKWFKWTDEEKSRLINCVNQFEERFPESLFQNNISLFRLFMNSGIIRSKMLYHAYDTPTIFELNTIHCDTVYYYHFIGHDSRENLDILENKQLYQKGKWAIDSSIVTVALPSAQAVSHYLILSEKEMTNFNGFDSLTIGNLSMPFEVNVFSWNEIPFAIKKNEETYVSYLVVQDHRTGKPQVNQPIYNARGIKVNQTNQEGITTYKLKDSMHYMVHNRDTFSVDDYSRKRYWYKESAIAWDNVWDWFARFERYSREDRREDTEFKGFTDRVRYRPGDTVFYKAYGYLDDDRVYDDMKRLRYYLKKVAVNMVNMDRVIIATDTVYIQKNHAINGYFILPQDAKRGSYEIQVNDHGNYGSNLSFTVEDYIDEKYIMKLEKVKELYKRGDTIQFKGYIESRTGERLSGTRIEVKGAWLLTTDVITDEYGEFFIQCIANQYNSIGLKALTPTGEVIRANKHINVDDTKYSLQRMYINREKGKIALLNAEDQIQKDTIVHLHLFEGVKVNKYHQLKGSVRFSKEEFVNWFPLAVVKKDSLVAVQTIHSSDTLSLISYSNYSKIVVIIGEDTINGNHLFNSNVGQFNDLMYFNYAERGYGKKVKLYSTHQYLTYLNRKRNGHYFSKSITIKNGSNSYLNRKARNGKMFEVISKDGFVETATVYIPKMYKPTKPKLYIEWDSLPYEMYPNEQYTTSFFVKKGKREVVNTDVTLYMAKEEHVSKVNYPYLFKPYPNYRHNNRGNWKWLTLTKFYNDKIYKINSNSQLEELDYTFTIDGRVMLRTFKTTSGKLDEINIFAYRRPLISKDAGATGSVVNYIGREDIAKLPVRSADGVARTIAGVNDVGALSIRGSRSDDSYYYIDGVKVRGAFDEVKSDQEEREITTGGVPGSFGDEKGGIDREDEMLSFDQIRERNRFGDTQFFIPQVKRNGKRYEVTFTQNDEITAWQVVAVAGTRNYQYAQGRQRLISVQPVQLIENTPRFVRVGDTVVIGGNIFNRTADTLTFKPTLNIYQSVSNANLNIDFGVQDHPMVKVAPHQTLLVEWKVNVPTYYLKTLDLEMAVAGKQHGDRFKKSIPVLQRKGIYEVGQTFVKVDQDTLQFVLDKETYLSETAEILETHFYVNGNKEIEYLIQRGKALENPTLITSTGLASNWALVTELHEMIAAKPALKILLDRELKAVIDSIEANKTEALKVVDLSKRLFVIMQLQELVDAKRYAEIAQKHSEELVKFLDEKGEYKWLQESEKGSVWTTRSVIRSLAKIKYLKFPVDEQLYAKWANNMEEELKLYIGSKDKVPFWSWRWYYELDDYAVLKDEWSTELQEIWKCFVREKWQNAGTTAQLYFAHLALKKKETTLAQQIAKSILSYTSYSKSKGRFIPKQSRGGELENQAELIFLLEKLGGYNREIVQLQQYMQIHQDYNDWSSRGTNAEYLRALICGPSQEHLLNKYASIIINQKRNDLELTKNHAVYVDVTQDNYEIAVISHPDLVVTGGLKVKFTDEMEKVNRSTDDRLRMERFIYYKVGSSWKLVTENTVIPLGSAIRIDVEFAASNEFSHLIVELPRITGLEFNNSRSGYRYGQVRYYAEMKNDVVKLYVDRIRDGKSTISLEGVVTNAGTFLFAPSSLTSEQNPEIGVTDKSLKVKIEK